MTHRAPTVACQRCRDQKLRCDRVLPSCMRCRKQGAVCTYPPPPDRKRIAERTSLLRALNANASNLAENSRKSNSAENELANKRQCTDEGAHEQRVAETAETNLNEDNEDASLPSTEIGLLLLEVYFKRIYLAPLLFHKSIAFQLYMESKLPTYLLRALFAHAAVFLKEIDAQCKEHISIMPMHRLYAKSWAWARASSKQVLQNADEPNLLLIQALQVLQFYYFSRGETKRAIVHASLAHRLSQLLGYDQLRDIAGSDVTERRTRFERVDREIRRRCFWASWCSSCIGGCQLESFRMLDRVAGLPLPAQFDKARSARDVDLNLGPMMTADWRMSGENSFMKDSTESAPPSLAAQLVRLVGIWYVNFLCLMLKFSRRNPYTRPA